MLAPGQETHQNATEISKAIPRGRTRRRRVALYAAGRSGQGVMCGRSVSLLPSPPVLCFCHHRRDYDIEIEGLKRETLRAQEEHEGLVAIRDRLESSRVFVEEQLAKTKVLRPAAAAAAVDGAMDCSPRLCPSCSPETKNEVSAAVNVLGTYIIIYIYICI